MKISISRYVFLIKSLKLLQKCVLLKAFQKEMIPKTYFKLTMKCLKQNLYVIWLRIC